MIHINFQANQFNKRPSTVSLLKLFSCYVHERYILDQNLYSLSSFYFENLVAHLFFCKKHLQDWQNWFWLFILFYSFCLNFFSRSLFHFYLSCVWPSRVSHFKTIFGTLREKTVLSVLDFNTFDLKSEPRTTHTKNTKIVIEIFSVWERAFENGRYWFQYESFSVSISNRSRFRE